MPETQTTYSASIKNTQPANYTAQIEARRAALKQMETARLGAQKDKEHAEKRLEELYAEVRALGVEPENLGEEIERLETEIKDGLAQVGSMIPEEFRKQVTIKI